MPPGKYRVVQWATGNVGRRAIPALLEHPELDLVGLWVHSADKVGRDAGDIAACEPSGIRATDDVEALVALQQDCVLYTPLSLDDDLVTGMLRRGINVVTTCAGFLTGTNLEPGRREAIEEAALTLPERTGQGSKITGTDEYWRRSVDGTVVTSPLTS